MTDFVDLARLQAEATPGETTDPKPWVTSSGMWRVEYPVPGAGVEWAWSPRPEFGNTPSPQKQAEFVIAARNAVPEFLRIREETLALHRPVSVVGEIVCEHCFQYTSPLPRRVPYPCPTVRILSGESE